MTSTEHRIYRPLDPEFMRDPYPGYRTLRDDDPVHYHADPEFWALSRFDDVWTTVRDPESFSSAFGLTFWPDEITRLGTAQLEDEIRTFVLERLADLEHKAADGAPADLHRDFASPIPTFVLARLLGVPAADRGRFDTWVRALVEIQNDGFAVSDRLTGKEAVAEMFGYFSDAIGRRRDDPGDDLLSALVAAEIDGERLTDWDILGFCFVMVAGGNDTTGNLISHGVQLLDGDHAQRDLLAGDPSLIPGAVLEFLRLEGSVQALARTTTRPVRVRDSDIPEGSKVLLLYGSANRDQREFGDTAETLDVTRTIRRHLGFAHGPHFCIGSHLARLQARVAFEELLVRQPHIGVDTTAGERLLSSFTRGWVSLPATGIQLP